MRAVGVMRYGGPEALEIVELPEEHAGPGQVRLRVHAAAVSPTDTFVRNGARAEQQQVDPPPYVPGMDAAGVVDEVGEGVATGIAVGDHAMAIVLPKGAHGAYRESIVLPAESVARAPAGSSHAEASTLPMNGLTAVMSLDLLGLSAGQTLAVTGAAGAFGGYMVQLGKAAGLVVVADASDADRELVASLGADVVLPRGDGFAARVRERFPDGVDAVADGAVLNERVLPALRDGGAFNAVRGWKGPPERGITFTATIVAKYRREHAKLDQLGRQAEKGVVTLRVDRTYPAEQAAEAHRRLEAGGARGRQVILF
ncbi:MAG: NADP-dependent oxidoreductase [Acidimicrobiales bacterium]